MLATPSPTRASSVSSVCDLVRSVPGAVSAMAGYGDDAALPWRSGAEQLNSRKFF